MGAGGGAVCHRKEHEGKALGVLCAGAVPSPSLSFPILTDVPKEDADHYILPNETQYLLISNLRRHAISLQTLLKAVEYYQGLAG